nr:hypothetical protein [Pleurocapsa sp. FMAR1]
MTEATLPTQLDSSIGGIKNVYNWNFLGKQYQIVYETIGAGNPILLRSRFVYEASYTKADLTSSL